MTLNSEKCRFAQSSVKFLGHVIDSTIQKVPALANVGEVRHFLGMVNQLSKFAPNLAEITQPMRALLVKENTWVWGEPQQRAFAPVKEVLTGRPVLALLDLNVHTVVSADASSLLWSGS